MIPKNGCQNTPIKERHGDLDDYILAPRWGYGEYRGRPDVIKVFDSLNARISAGEVNDIRASLPSAPARSGQRREVWENATGPKVCGGTVKL
jgi:hypothetical protein